MRSLVDQFATLAEFPAARLRPADINVIVENSLALFAGRLGNIKLRRALAPNLPLVSADPEALSRALSNLIDNAAEAMQDSLHRELTLSTRLLSSSPGSTDMVELAVADTGQGISPEFLPFVFERFRQADVTMTRQHGGMGLGPG